MLYALAKKKLLHKYIDRIIKVFEENPEVLLLGRCVHKGGSDQIWIVVSSGEGDYEFLTFLRTSLMNDSNLKRSSKFS